MAHGIVSLFVSALVGVVVGAVFVFFKQNQDNQTYSQSYDNDNTNTNSRTYPERNVPVQPAPNCSICYEALGSAQLEMLPCTHLFHQHCLIQWLNEGRSQNRCPVCRFTLTTEQFRIYQERNKI